MISRSVLALLSLGFVAGGCSSIPEAPAPVALEARPHEESQATLESLRRDDELGARLAPPSPPAVPRPQPRVEWSPERPRQASAVTFRIEQPAGPELEDLSVRFAESDVMMARSGNGWVGVGGLPLDSAGFFELELSFLRDRARETRTLLVPVVSRTYPSTRIRISAGGTADPELDARIARERETIRRVLAKSSPHWIPDAPVGWPRSPVVKTSPFGQRRVFNGSVRSRHMGLDLRAFGGHPIMAPAAGRVVLAGRFVYQGNAVYLDHGLGVITGYFHMSRLRVEEGDVVSPGQVLGLSGSTGRSTAPHLHWSAYVQGRTVDPESLVGLYPVISTPMTEETSSP